MAGNVKRSSAHTKEPSEPRESINAPGLESTGIRFQAKPIRLHLEEARLGASALTKRLVDTEFTNGMEQPGKRFQDPPSELLLIDIHKLGSSTSLL